jgi:hypothetical protein
LNLSLNAFLCWPKVTPFVPSDLKPLCSGIFWTVWDINLSSKTFQNQIHCPILRYRANVISVSWKGKFTEREKWEKISPKIWKTLWTFL